MDFRQLRTFSCVAELGSLSKASDTLRVAQPALSRQIKLLEHELRAELFTRNGRGMVLTEAGRLLLARTAGIVRQIDQIRDDIQSAGGAPSGRVVLGLVPTVSCVLSARLARRTVESYPGISLCIVESYSGHLIEWLHRGEMDLAVIYGPSVDLHLSVQSLGRDDDRRRRAARLRAGAEKAGRDRLAVATAAGAAKSFARAPGADRARGGEEENEARRPDRSGFLPGSHQPRRGRARIHAAAAFVGAQRSRGRPARNRRDRQTGSDART